MRYNSTTLSNGLRIIHLPSVAQVVYCGYQIAAGTRHEAAGEEGLAHFVEHTTFKGTSKRNSLQVINALETVGGDLNAFTTKEHTVYYAAILKNHFRKAVDVLSDIVFHSTYPEQEVEKEKDVVVEEIESYNDTPSELIFDDFENIIFKDEPLGHNILGTEENVRAFTADDARSFAHRHYRADNSVFFVYGDISFDAIVAAVGKTTADLPQITADNSAATMVQCARTGVAAADLSAGGQLYEVDRATHQAHVMIGTRAYGFHHEHRTALYLLNNILGGPALSARLSLVLRERHGLVYSVESNMVSYSDTGVWMVYFGCDQHDVKRCIALVRRELDKFVKKPISSQKLKAAKQQLKGQIGVACDNRENFALDFGKHYLFFGTEKSIDQLFLDIDSVTADEIQTVAAALFADDKLTTLVYT